MILSCGEALVDLIPTTTAEGEPLLRPVLGGGPFNAAIAVARLGAPAGFVGRVSDQGYGDAFTDRLREEGVDLRYLSRGGEPTTMALVTRLPNGDNHYDLYLQGTSALTLTDADMPVDLADVTALHIGTLGLAVEPAASAFGGLLEREACRRVVSLDPNIRPAAIRDMAAHRRRIERWAAMAAVVKVSDADLAHLYPGDDPLEVARHWSLSCPGVVVLTQGADGAHAWNGVAAVHVPGVPVSVVDTVGAGDTLAAALLVWLWERDLLRTRDIRALDAGALTACLRFACAAAAITCSRPGADPPRRDQLSDGAENGR